MQKNKTIQIIILGITGDLSTNKLIPSLFNLYKKGLLAKNVQIIGISRHDYKTVDLLDHLEDIYKNNEKIDIDHEEDWDGFRNTFTYISGSFDNVQTFNDLKNVLDDEQEIYTDRIIYFATASSNYGMIIDSIVASRLKNICSQGNTRVVIEKPFGSDYDSALRLNNKISEIFSEDQMFRIDHVLGKNALVDIISLRQLNPLIDSLFDYENLDHIQVSYLETIGAEERLNFYDQTGVIRDMVQNHLLQILAMLTMQIPKNMDSKNLSDAKSQIISALKPIKIEDVVIAQYQSGDGKRGYRDELGTSSYTPTFIALKTYLKHMDKNIPIYMRTGKRLRTRYTEISLVFKTNKISGNLKPNILSFRIQPNAGIYIVLTKRNLRAKSKSENIVMDYCYQDTHESELHSAYENLLLQVIKGDNTYFVNIDEILNAWKFVDPVNSWVKNRDLDLKFYSSGSLGPDEGLDLIERDGAHWYAEDFAYVCNLNRIK